MAFIPSIHGWPFSDVPDVPAYALGLGVAPDSGTALGAGLCWAALDRYLRGIRIPRETEAPDAGDPLHAELARRQTEAVAGSWARVREWQDRPEGSWRDRLPVAVAGGRDLASMSRTEWHRVRGRVARGEPVLLALLEHADAYRRGRAVRHVLATGWQLADARVLVSLYDPARPDDDRVTLGFGPAGPFDARLTGGTPIRGFFAIPYDRKVPHPVRAETFGDRSVIGLNRKVRGAVSGVARRKRLDLVARDPDGALVHFERRHGQSWEGANITEREGFGSFELHSDPVATLAGGRLHIFARSYVGDLLHFQLGRSWRVDNRTDEKRAGARFRITGPPVAIGGAWGRVSVLGRDKDGGLVHYSGQPVTGWRAEQVAGDPLDDDPVATLHGDTLHVAGRARDGRVLHWARTDGEWTALDLSAVTEVRTESTPVLRSFEHGVHIALRTPDGQLVVLVRDDEGGWTAHRVARGVTGDPVLSGGPAGAHVFARTEAGGLAHGWRAGAGEGAGWRGEDVLDSRPALPALPAGTGLTAWGGADELRVWTRSERELWTLVWRPDGDWCVETLGRRAGVAERHHPGEDPRVLEDHAGRPHLLFTDGRGTVLHVEPAEWREPGDGDAGGARPAVSKPAAAKKPAAAQKPAAQESPAEKVAAEKVAAEKVAAEKVAAEKVAAEKPVAGKPAGGKGAGAAPPAPETVPPLPLLDDPAEESGSPEGAGAEEPDPLPLLEDPEPAAKPAPSPTTATDLPFLDFEADPAAGSPQAWPDEPEESGEAEAPVEAEASVEAEGEDATETKPSPEASPEPSSKPPSGSSASADPEPMDLSLLDTWPPAPPSMRRRRGGDDERQAS